MKGEDQLKQELHDFQQEKDRIRNIVGQVGGSAGTKHNNIINTVLLLIMGGLLLLGGLLNKIELQLALEVAILVGIMKLLWMFYEAQKASHFQFWILNSLEFRVNEIHKRVRKMEKKMNEAEANKKETKKEEK